MRWRLELSTLSYGIVYKKGSENVAADALSRIATVSFPQSVDTLHRLLCHPGVTRLWDYINRHKLPFSLDEVRRCISTCQTCLEWKPRFFRPDKSHIIKATRPFERISIDIVGPKCPSRTGNRYLLTVIDEYSRFPFAVPIKDISARSVINSLKSIFSFCGTPAFIHSDRGTQFMSNEFDIFCHTVGIAHSRTTPYNPKGNGQCERFNGTIWKAVVCTLHSRNLSEDKWEDVLPDVLASIRTLICTATKETPHDRFFNFQRRTPTKYTIPHWMAPGNPVYVKNVVRNKDDPLVHPAQVVEVINDQFIKVANRKGVVDTISSSKVSRGSIVPNPRRPLQEGECPGEDNDPFGSDASQHAPVNDTEIIPDIPCPVISDPAPASPERTVPVENEPLRRSKRLIQKPSRFGSFVDSQAISEDYHEDEIVWRYDDQQ